jgi:glyoxylase-like metal-dependent hydrolase (beta-lactamase superfamily II)
MDARIDRVVTGEWADRNVWVIGDDDEVIVVDPGRDAQVVLDAVGDREIIAVICTHGHADHVQAALEVAERDEALVALHPKDRLIWSEVHDDSLPDIDMEEGGAFEVAGVALEVLNTPGHTPGSVSIYCEDLGVVFSGDALSADGPCAHDGAFPDFAGQLSAIGAELLPLPATTRVLPGHGEESTIAQAESRFDSWFAARPKISGDTDD